jgi:molybdenum cofactor biosynthesis enzyme MoaA
MKTGINHDNPDFFIDNKLRIAITNRCNLSCFYCHNEGQPHESAPAMLSLEYIKNMISFLQKNNVYIQAINLTGGEPLLHPNLINIVIECAKITNDLEINTNGTMLTNEKVDNLIKYGVTGFKIGVDSIFAEQTKPNVYSTPQNIEKTIDIIKYANSKMSVVLNTVITKHNFNHVDGMINFAMQIRIPRMKILRLNDLDSRKINDLDIDPDMKTDQPVSDYFFNFYRKYLDKAIRYELHKYRGRTDVFLPNGNEEFEIRFCDDVCASGACALMFTGIDANGNIMVCPRHHIFTPLNFNEPFSNIKKLVRKSAKFMCDSRENQFLLLDNFKDIGDIPIDNDRKTVKRIIARSANPVPFWTEKYEELIKQGYTTVIDIRRPDEIIKKYEYPKYHLK